MPRAPLAANPLRPLRIVAATLTLSDSLSDSDAFVKMAALAVAVAGALALRVALGGSLVRHVAVATAATSLDSGEEAQAAGGEEVQAARTRRRRGRAGSDAATRRGSSTGMGKRGTQRE